MLIIHTESGFSRQSRNQSTAIPRFRYFQEHATLVSETEKDNIVQYKACIDRCITKLI